MPLTTLGRAGVKGELLARVRTLAYRLGLRLKGWVKEAAELTESEEPHVVRLRANQWKPMCMG